MEVLESSCLCRSTLFLPSVNIRVKDALFGGLRTPTLAPLRRPRRPAASDVADRRRAPQDVAHRHRRDMGEPAEDPRSRLEAAYLPTARRRGRGQPFKLNKEARAFELPSNEWEWTSDWQLDSTLNAKDADGWGYAFDFNNPGGDVYELGAEEPLTLARRRWYRTRTPTWRRWRRWRCSGGRAGR